MKKAFVYVRVSTDEQKKHGLSVDAQIVALKEYCEKTISKYMISTTMQGNQLTHRIRREKNYFD